MPGQSDPIDNRLGQSARQRTIHIVRIRLFDLRPPLYQVFSKPLRECQIRVIPNRSRLLKRPPCRRDDAFCHLIHPPD